MTTDASASPDVVAIAEGFAATLRRRATEIEAAGRLPQDLASELAAAGLYRLWMPLAHGGFETPPPDAMRALEVLAAADASTAWCVFIGITSTLPLANLSDDTIREIFAKPETRLSGVFEPAGLATPVEGGLRVSGEWSFGSGSYNADWIGAGVRIGDAENPSATSYIFVPASDVKLLGTWDVSGLCGTGSTHFRMEDVFVPARRAIGLTTATPPDRPLYRFSMFTLLGMSIGAIANGLARAALDEFAHLASTKAPAGGRRPLSQRPNVQLEIGRAETRLRAARAYFHQTLQAAWQAAVKGDPISREHCVEIRTATCNAVDAALEITQCVHRLAGSAALYRSSPLQRYLRDAQVVAQHIMARPVFYELAGSHFLGEEHPSTAFL
ncbi:MAG: acyl-CoA dehydrogenase family protein [Deltaproteobacteria bacterium]